MPNTLANQLAIIFNFIKLIIIYCIHRGVVVASQLLRSTPDQVGWVDKPGPHRGHCVVFLGKTLYSPSASLHPGVYMGTSEFNAGGNSVRD